MKKFNGLISINRVSDNLNGDYISIKIQTKKLRMICESRIELKEFAEAVTGLSCTPTEIKTWGIDLKEGD